MDYKYIEQLLERYWQCETSLEEEKILCAFFSQKDVPVSLLPYKALFSYECSERNEDVLGDDFDARILALVEEKKPVKVRTIKMTQRLLPLFKAAAVIAIFLTLGNAAQMAFDRNPADSASNMSGVQSLVKGKSVAMGDSLKTDTLQNAGHLPVNALLK